MFEIITTRATDTDGVKYTRPALVYIYKSLAKVLDYPYVWACKFAEFNTAVEYLKILRRFVSYLLLRPSNHFDENGILDFWLYVTAGDIKAWQQSRTDELMASGKGAKWDTIVREAQIVTQFLHFVSKSGERMLYNPRTKTILARAVAEDSMLKGMVESRKEKEVIDYEDIRIPRPVAGEEDADCNDLYPDDDTSLQNNFGYLPAFQIDLAMELFADPVYVAISFAGQHTGLRNFEVLGIPVMTAGHGFVSSPIMLRSKLRKGQEEMILNVTGKGSNTRPIPFDVETWLAIMEFWWPEFEKRKKRYKETTGKELPANVLWITKGLKPLYCDPKNKPSHKVPLERLHSAFRYISQEKKVCTKDAYGFKINYYKFRHTFATLYYYDAMKSADDWDGARWLKDISIREDLRKRMGHKLLTTTIENYVESAIFLHLQEKGNAKHWFPDTMAHLDKIQASRCHI
jgi:hypothetical protein